MLNKRDYEEKSDKVKMYKTHHGWVSCLTRFFSILHFSKKVETKQTIYTDPDELDNHVSDTVNSYLKGLGLLSTILGIGGGVGAISPTTVQAATRTVNMSSQVIGSTSASQNDNSSLFASQQDSASTSTTQSQSDTQSTTQTSLSTANSTSTSVLSTSNNINTNSTNNTTTETLTVPSVSQIHINAQAQLNAELFTQASNWQSSTIYPSGETSLVGGYGWGQIQVKSPILGTVNKGDAYYVNIGNTTLFDYDTTPVTTNKFDVQRISPGVYKLTAKDTYTANADFDITIGVKPKEIVTANKTITVPVSVTTPNNIIQRYQLIQLWI